MAALRLAAAATAASALAGSAAALGPSASGLYDCAGFVEEGCFKGPNSDGVAFPQFQGGKAFLPAHNRDGSFNPLSGTTLERCAQFCAINYYTLSAVATNFSAEQNLTVAHATCSCGNSTTAAGAKLASSACAAPPLGGGNYSHPPKACVSGTASCGCAANYSQSCGMAGVSRVYRAKCTPSHGPGRYICPFKGGQYMENGSDISYQSWVDCFGGAVLEGVPTLGVPVVYSNSHYAVAPHYALLCNMTQRPSSWYCQQAVAGLKGFSDNPTSSAMGYHAYEPLLTYQALVDAGIPAAGLTPTELTAFQGKMFDGVMAYVGHETRVENHGLDSAIQQLWIMKVFPNINCTTIKGERCSYDKTKMMRIPNQILSNWQHGHALDEYAIGYDAISIVRLIGVLELIDTTDDLHSQDWKDFVLRFADSITPTGCFSNHGGGLQDDGAPDSEQQFMFGRPGDPVGSCSGVFPFTYFFEKTATLFQHKDPKASSYCKWAARSLFRQINPFDDFENFYYVIMALEEEKKQIKAGGPIPIPDLVDIRSKTVMKNEYQKDENRVDGGPVPAQHLLCPSRAPGSPYVQSSVYTVPDGYHGSGEQAGTMSHYEYGDHLFIYSGMQTKHTSQSDADTGLPILMPYSAAADGRFPWRWGQHNLSPGKWQRVDTTTSWLSGSEQQAGNWDSYQPVHIQSKGTYRSSGPSDVLLSANIGFSCDNFGAAPYHLLFGPVSIVADNGTVRVVDDFSYHKQVPDAWGAGTSWVYPHGPDHPILRLECAPNSHGMPSGKAAGNHGATIVWRPGGVSPSAGELQSAAPCPPTPCPPGPHEKRTYCSSDPTRGQCDKPTHKPCPPCKAPPAPPPPTGIPPLNMSFEVDDWPYLRHTFMIDPSYPINATSGFNGAEAGGGYAVSNYLNSGIPFRFLGVGWPRSDKDIEEYIAPTSAFIARFDNFTASTSAHNDSGGGWGAAGYGGWTRETQWTRRMVLTAEGALIVLDHLQTSEQDDGWLGGPLWQMNLASNCSNCENFGNCTSVHGVQPRPDQCNLTKPEAEGDWFDLSGFEITTKPIDRYRGMLPKRLNLVAKMANGKGKTHGAAPGFMASSTCPSPTATGGCDWAAQPPFSTRPKGSWLGFPWQTLWSKQRIASNSAAAFVSCFVPYEAASGKAAAQAVAKSIEIQLAASDDSATVKLTPSGATKQLTVTLDIHGKWTVTR